MTPKEGSCRPSKRTTPIEALESGYAGDRKERRDAQSEMEREIERLRSENRRLREAEAQGRS